MLYKFSVVRSHVITICESPKNKCRHRENDRYNQAFRKMSCRNWFLWLLREELGGSYCDSMYKSQHWKKKKERKREKFKWINISVETRFSVLEGIGLHDL